MASNQKYIDYTGSSPSDISLSCWECEDFINAVNDDRLSPDALFRFKTLYRAHSFNLLVVPIITFPFAYLASKWLVGFANRGMASSRLNFFGMALFWPMTLYYGYTKPTSRKAYTELFSDPSDDGDYIRDSVAYHKPGLWKKVSKQLEQLKLDFKQNISSQNNIEFPISFVSSRYMH